MYFDLRAFEKVSTATRIISGPTCSYSIPHYFTKVNNKHNITFLPVRSHRSNVKFRSSRDGLRWSRESVVIVVKLNNIMSSESVCVSVCVLGGGGVCNFKTIHAIRPISVKAFVKAHYLVPLWEWS